MPKPNLTAHLTRDWNTCKQWSPRNFLLLLFYVTAGQRHSQVGHMYYSDFRELLRFQWFHVDACISLNWFHVDGKRFGNDSVNRLHLSPCGRCLRQDKILIHGWLIVIIVLLPDQMLYFLVNLPEVCYISRFHAITYCKINVLLHHTSDTQG